MFREQVFENNCNFMMTWLLDLCRLTLSRRVSYKFNYSYFSPPGVRILRTEYYDGLKEFGTVDG